jgi:hypothetical protein
MKTEHFFFLVLVLCAAVVIGATLGIASNLKYISHQVKLNQDLERQKELQEAKADSIQPLNTAAENNDTAQIAAHTAKPVTEATTGTSASNTAVPANTAAGAASGLVEDGNLMLLTQAEQQQVESMLDMVDASKNADYSDRIKEFQKKHSLSVTGILDATTLGALIQQAKLLKATNLAR